MKWFVALAVPALLGAAGVETDIEFGRAGDVSLKLDVSVPEGKGPFPTVVIVHGGGWRGGDKQFAGVKPLFEPLTRAGFVWFSINYRLAPRHRYPAAVEDVETALRWVKSNAKKYKVDLRRLAITGESAGGHLVALVGARNRSGVPLAAVVPFYPPTDMEGLSRQRGRANEAIQGFLGISELNDAALKLLREASPITYIKKGMPPYLFIHGTKDVTVPFEESTNMCGKMKKAGAVCEVVAVEGAPHGIGGWEKNPAWLFYKEKMIQWLRAAMR